ncbi:MAG: hypothetical protein HYV32_05395 [Candidatus Kerfeldbacteria bacterium]|nr:hypothetical protein [Candidatus Kerfeldbacteria bacterium]
MAHTPKRSKKRKQYNPAPVPAKPDIPDEKVQEVNADDDLRLMYADDDEEEVDMTTMEKKPRRGKWIVLAIGIMVLLLGVMYLGYVVFRQQSGSAHGEVTMNMQVEDKVASGDVVTIELDYMNNKNVPLTKGKIELLYPDGFSFASSLPIASSDNNRSWNIENLPAGTGGKIRITGQLVGQKDEQKTISALFTYQPSNFQRDFQESAQSTVTITSSIIDVSVDAPSQVQSNQELTYKVQYTNTSKLALNHVKVLMEYPHGFSVTSTDPAATVEDNEWRIDTLEPKQTQTITIVGTLDGDSGETKEFHVKLGIVEIDNTFSLQSEKSSLVVIVNPEIDLQISASETVAPGEKVPLNIEVKNTSDIEIKEVKVVLSFIGGLFTEDEYTFPVIDTLSPQETMKLTYATTLADDATTDTKNLNVSASVVSAKVEGREVSFSNEATVSMNVEQPQTKTKTQTNSNTNKQNTDTQ